MASCLYIRKILVAAALPIILTMDACMEGDECASNDDVNVQLLQVGVSMHSGKAIGEIARQSNGLKMTANGSTIPMQDGKSNLGLIEVSAHGSKTRTQKHEVDPPLVDTFDIRLKPSYPTVAQFHCALTDTDLGASTYNVDDEIEMVATNRITMVAPKCANLKFNSEDPDVFLAPECLLKAHAYGGCGYGYVENMNAMQGKGGAPGDHIDAEDWQECQSMCEWDTSKHDPCVIWTWYPATWPNAWKKKCVTWGETEASSNGRLDPDTWRVETGVISGTGTVVAKNRHEDKPLLHTIGFMKNARYLECK